MSDNKSVAGHFFTRVMTKKKPDKVSQALVAGAGLEHATSRL